MELDESEALELDETGAMKWNVEDLGVWLCAKGWRDMADLFVAEEIDGSLPPSLSSLAKNK